MPNRDRGEQPQDILEQNDECYMFRSRECTVGTRSESSCDVEQIQEGLHSFTDVDENSFMFEQETKFGSSFLDRLLLIQ